MRVPTSPHNMRRVVTEPVFKTDMDDVLMRPPKPTYTSRVKDGKITVGVEAYLTDTDVTGKENRNPGSSSYHRSRERTRQPAVLRRVERKLAQKEKERERDRASRGGEYSSLTRDYVRDRSWSRSECGSVRSSSVNGSTTEHIASYRHRTSRSCSGSRPDAATTKTYITIGPGKPTRIREHSPSKTPKEEKTRDKSPTKKRSDLLLGSSTPLKSTELFRDISNGKLSDQDNNNNNTRKTSFTTEKTFIVNSDQLGRRLSIDFTDDDEVLPTAEKQQRASPESDQGFRSVSSCSNFSSNFSGSTDSVESSTSDRENHLSKRRISLEQRFRARVNRVPSPERKNQDGFNGSASSRLLYNLSSGYRYHRAAVSSNSSRQPFRRFSQDHQRDLQQKQESPRSRKISLPQSYYQAQDYQYKSFTTLSAESLAEQKKEEGNQLYKSKNYREAITRYSEAISLCPATPAYYGNRAACHMMLNQYPQALDDAKQSVQLDSSFIKGYSRMAKCCIAVGDVISAKQAIQSAVNIDPDTTALDTEKQNLDVLEKFHTDAQQAYQEKDFRKALYCLDRALSIATASRHLKVVRAECLAFLARYVEAQEVANDILRQDGMNADAMYVRGLCLYYEDNVDKAFSHFQQVLRLAPDHQKAKDTYKKAKTLRSKKEEGNIAFKNGQLQEAYQLYTQALDIDPLNKMTNAKLYFNRATVAARLGKLRDSVSDCTKAIDLDDSYLKAYVRRGKSYNELEEYEEAVRDFEAVHRLDRSNPEYRRMLQDAKIQLKRSKRKDYYKILGVDRNANDDEIKKAYRKRAMVHHPDRHSNASDNERKEHEKKFKEVGEAYGVLSDAKKRSRYDNGADLEDLDGGAGFGQEMDPNHIFQAFFGGGMPGGAQHFSFGGGGPGAMPGGFTFQFG